MSDKELGEEIRTIVANDIFELIKKILVVSKSVNEGVFDSKSFRADCGLAYLDLHEKILEKHVYTHFPEINPEHNLTENDKT